MKHLNALLPEVPYELKDFVICDEAVRLLEGYFLRELLIFVATKGSALVDYRGHSKIDVSTIECLVKLTDLDIKEIYQEKSYFYEAAARAVLDPISGTEILNSDQVEKAQGEVWRLIEDWGASLADQQARELVLGFVTHAIKRVIIEAGNHANSLGRKTIWLPDIFAISGILPWPLEKWLC